MASTNACFEWVATCGRRVDHGRGPRQHTADEARIGDRAARRGERRRQEIDADDLVLGAEDPHEGLAEVAGAAGDDDLHSGFMNLPRRNTGGVNMKVMIAAESKYHHAVVTIPITMAPSGHATPSHRYA